MFIVESDAQWFNDPVSELLEAGAGADLLVMRNSFGKRSQRGLHVAQEFT